MHSSCRKIIACLGLREYSLFMFGTRSQPLSLFFACLVISGVYPPAVRGEQDQQLMQQYTDLITSR
ncbi:MAG: hypothetical protein JWR26_2941, partial [Pedosphaera sp.]|nr:hypothetical protein [Pedosphaera sp.]